MVTGKYDENGASREDGAQQNGAQIMISNDRSSVSIRLTGEGCYACYKKAAQNREFVNACEQAELFPATVTSDGYSCSIRGRVTLKEIVCGDDVLTFRTLRGVAACLQNLITCADDYGVDARDFVYDYNAVMVRHIDSDYKFPYMPGSRFAGDRTTVNDLIKIVFLNIDSESVPEADYELIRDDVRRIRSEENAVEVVEDLERLIARIDGLTPESTFRDKLFSFFRLKPARQDEPEREPLVFNVKGLGEIEDVNFERRVAKDRSICLKIGRDGEWADICVPSLFASRRHAELVISGDGKMSLENCSLNGIYVDGEETDGCIEKPIKGLEVRIQITDNCGIVLSAA